MIKHLAQISGSEYHEAAVKAHMEIVAAGHGDGSNAPFNWDDKISVCVAKNGTLQGLMVWRYMKWMRQSWIITGWVDHGSRRKGIYAALYKAVCKEAKKIGATKISGGIYSKNGVMINAATKQGRKVEYVVYSETL